MAAALSLWLPRAMEAMWLLIAGLVPVIFAPGDFMVFFDVPKVILLRGLAGLMGLLLVVEWAASARGPGYKVNAPHPQRWIVVTATLFLAAYAISTLLSTNPSTSLWGNTPGRDGYGLYNMVSHYLLFIAIATHLRTEAQLWRLLYAVTAGAVVASAYGVIQHYGIDPFDQPFFQGRVQSSFGNPLFAASFLTLAAPITLGLGLVNSLKCRGKTPISPPRGRGETERGILPLSRGIPREGRALTPLVYALWTTLLAIQLAAIAFTLSRGPWLGLGVGMIAWLILMWRASGIRAASRGLVLLVIAATAALALAQLGAEVGGDAVPQPLERLAGRAVSISEELTTAGLNGRLSIWRRAASLALERPWFEPVDWWFAPVRHLFGYGPEILLYALPLRWEPGTTPFVLASAHNYLIHIMVELGLVGVLAFITFLASLILASSATLWRSRTSLKPGYAFAYIALLSSVLVRVVEQMLGIARVSDTTLFWIVAATLAALPVVVAEGSPHPNPPPFHGGGEIKVPSPVKRGRVRVGASWRWAVAAVVVIIGCMFLWQKNVSYARAAALGSDAERAFQQRQLRASIELMDKAIALAPDVDLYYISRAQLMDAFAVRDASDEAEIASEQYGLLKKALRANPLSHTAKLELAASALKLAQGSTAQGIDGQDKGAEAIQHYTELTRMLPAFEQIYNDLATAYLILGQPEEALDALDAFQSFTGGRHKPSDHSTTALYLRGVALQKLERDQEAAAALEHYLSRPADGRYVTFAHQRLAELYAALGDQSRHDYHAARYEELRQE